MEYNFSSIEKHWRRWWQEQRIYEVSNDNETQPKCYVLDMFPYPSGAGLHVGHPLGYIASDIYARYKRLRGYNVLHPMGYDAFGLPAEQYAIETGQHPAATTEKNIARYREQLDNIGFSYDWSREVRTSDPQYYKWTQWIFIQLFHSFFDRKMQQARPISELIAIFEKEGNTAHPAPGNDAQLFDSDTWNAMDLPAQRGILMNYRLAYLDHAQVWWCEALGTVLANDEVVNGVSERGGHPVERRRMRQWFLRITEYAERLLQGLDGLDWTDAMKDMQRNWIGKSQGAEVEFRIASSDSTVTQDDSSQSGIIKVFTTRPDTIFGVDFMVLAPEHELVDGNTTPEQAEEIAKYKTYVQSRSERERQAEVKQITGAFTGTYAKHPITARPIPIWISEYVLVNYGTGAIMAVPSGDERDHAFAKHFSIPITNIFGDLYSGQEAYSGKDAILQNSDFLGGLSVAKATEEAIQFMEESGIGRRRVNYRLRDAGFSRQRYWGEPFPIIYRNDEPYTIDESALSDLNLSLPVELPHVDKYGPGPGGQGPLTNLNDWVNTPAGQRETDTMPGYAGSSWYFLRYADPHNQTEFASRKATDYWNQVDVYIGGTEHAVGHLLYSRMWTKALCDLGHISFDEPFKKLVNQGMIQGSSRFIIRLATLSFRKETPPKHKAIMFQQKQVFLSTEVFADLASKDGQKANKIINRILNETGIDLSEIEGYSFGVPFTDFINIDINTVDDKSNIDIEALKRWRPSYNEASFIYYNSFTCSGQPEKMSKSKHNVVNPDDIVARYGADTFRLYEMFLGPIEVSKPWDTQGIEGVHRFLKKFWRLFADEATGTWKVNDEPATDAALRVVHKTIKKVGDDIEKFAYNTAVSQFMICVNELSSMGCRNRDVLHALVVLISPFAPHMAEELWQKCLGHGSSVILAIWPKAEEKYLTESTKMYGIAINGKTRTELEFPLDASQGDVEAVVLADATVQKWLEGKSPKKVIYVKGKMINVVV